MGIKDKIIEANSKDKTLIQNAWYSRNVARPISLYVTKPFIFLHPNTICLIMIIVGLLAIPFFIYGSYWSVIIGALILQVHYILDHVDGNVARLRNKRSQRGKYLDFLGNITVNPLSLLALGIGLFRSTGNLYYLYLGISAGFSYLAIEPARLFSYLMIIESGLKIKPAYATNNVSKNILLMRYLLVILSYPAIMNLILIFAVFNLTKYLIIFYGLTLPLLFIARTAYEFYKWKRIDNQKN
jgi:phosphatidylglycerophosphate synthase